jgi:short-subunit dehydrogenase
MPYALITGASKGIGKSIALELAKKNYDILLIARSPDLLQLAAEEIRSSFKVKVNYLSADLSEITAPQKIFDWCNKNQYPVSVLVNNAGFGLSGPFENHSVEETTGLIQVNVVCPTILCRLFIPMLKLNAQSYILNICSSSAYQAVPLLNVYASTKAYIRRFTRALRHELAHTGISVTCLSPGPTDTDWAHSANISKKAMKVADKLNMSPQKVASVAVNAMLKKKAEVIVGFINKLGAFLAWILPDSFVEKNASRLYKD